MRLDADCEESRDGEYDRPDDDYGYRDAADQQAWAPDDSAAYWRRRFLVLCGGVAALGLCAWLFPGAHQPSAHEAAAAKSSVAAAESRLALPPAALGRAYDPTPTASALTLPTALPGATPAAAKKKPKQKISLTYRPRSASSASPARAAGACAPGDIVLSLFTSQSSYTRRARPAFSVYAVSTASSPCTMPYGAGAVQVVVTRHGQVVWDSAACKPSPAQRERFTPGVPQVVKMIWNRKTAGPAGCAGSLAASASGTLDAVARHGSRSSPVRSFKVKG